MFNLYWFFPEELDNPAYDAELHFDILGNLVIDGNNYTIHLPFFGVFLVDEESLAEKLPSEPDDMEKFD